MIEELKKQFVNLFENSWKYTFIEIAFRGSPIYHSMINEKTSLEEKDEKEEKNRKWVELSK